MCALIIVAIIHQGGGGDRMGSNSQKEKALEFSS
jgi:hypothetical protein